MKKFLLKFLVSKSGQWLKYPISSALAVIGTTLARYGVQLNDAEQIAIIAWLTAAIPAILNDLVVKWTGDATEQVQAATGANIDRYLGPATVKSVQKAVLAPAKKSLPKSFGANK